MNWITRPLQPFARRWHQRQQDRLYAELVRGARHVHAFDAEGIVLPNDRTVISNEMTAHLMLGTYEKQERRFLDSLIEPGERVLELGTCLGLVASLCARNPHASHITTIEANPHLFDYARQVFEDNGVADRIQQLHGIALPQPDRERMPFYISHQAWASSTVNALMHVKEEVSVPVLDLDALIEAQEFTLMIMDIEGGEKALLERFTPGSIRKICLEFHPNMLGKDTIAALKQRLHELGFERDPDRSAGCVHSYLRA